jgi:hypothetical protein
MFISGSRFAAGGADFVFLRPLCSHNIAHAFSGALNTFAEIRFRTSAGWLNSVSGIKFKMFQTAFRRRATCVIVLGILKRNTAEKLSKDLRATCFRLTFLAGARTFNLYGH